MNITEISRLPLPEAAEEFIRSAYAELGISDQFESRMVEVIRQISETGTYVHTRAELEHGARVAWRNSNRCIGRLYWKTLKILDAREADTDEEIFKALCRHLEFATNGGEIRSTITIFRAAGPDGAAPRILNDQLIRYAGYADESGSVTGDPSQVNFTRLCMELGWSKPEKSRFDLLPWVWQWPGREPVWAEIPAELVMEVPLEHPFYDWWADLGLKWHAVPVISSMTLEIGGILYTAAPFNGWYMGTEVGSRNLGDVSRYNLLPLVAQKMGLDTDNPAILWKDRALVELNTSVLHSYAKAGVSMTDHHEASEQFVHFEQTECKKGRTIHAEWAWIVPPMSASATEVFHREYENKVVCPNFFYR